MIRDDASPEELDRWYRRPQEEIERERQQRRNAAWSALRTPEHLAREPETIVGGSASQALAGGSGRDQIAARPNAGSGSRRHIEAYEVGPDGKLQFTPEYAKHAEENHRRLMKAQDDINYWTNWEGVPALFNKSTGPLGALVTGAGLLTGVLSRYAKPPPERK